MSMDLTFYPWQSQDAQRFFENEARFAHAWLIQGEEGIGKLQFAKACAARLLCESPNANEACGDCSACAWLAHSNHPDLMLIRPDTLAALEGNIETDRDDDSKESSNSAKKNPSKEIRIEQIRSIEGWASKAAHRGGYKVVVLYYAEMLNLISANAILKVLEEPPAGTVFILITHQADRLLPTIISRCRRFTLTRPSFESALQWLNKQQIQLAQEYLAVNGGAPLKALQQSQAHSNPIPDYLSSMLDFLASKAKAPPSTLIDMVEKLALVEWLTALQKLLLDCLLMKHHQPVHFFPSLLTQHAKTIASIPAFALQDFYQYVTQQKMISQHPLNSKLFIYDILLRFSQLRS